MTLKVVDLFCGAGGFSHGFQSEGFEIVLGVDNWTGCQETYEFNHPNTEFLLMDINDLVPCTLPSADIIIGSPPCTNFSVVNPHKDESKGFVLIDKFLEIIQETKPTYWIMENVANKHLINHLNGFPKMVVYCSDFGLRQLRRRLFSGKFPQPMSMGSRGRKLVFPTVPAHPRKGQGDFAWQHESWEKKGIVFPSITTKDLKAMGDNRKQVKRWKELLYPTVTGRNAPQRGAVGQKEAWKKRDIDPEEYTPELAAWIQHFPDDFKFFGTKTAKHEMIGNAVPPEMARILARAIKEDHELS